MAESSGAPKKFLKEISHQYMNWLNKHSTEVLDEWFLENMFERQLNFILTLCRRGL